MTFRATGTFEVTVTPQAQQDKGQGIVLGRMALDKQFHGDLEAVGQGEMLTANTSAAGSAGYVAIEAVTGTLQGRTGSFACQHTGTLNRGAQTLSITVVPDSGAGQLSGIAGEISIRIVDGVHHYTFEYSLPS